MKLFSRTSLPCRQLRDDESPIAFERITFTTQRVAERENVLPFTAIWAA